MTLRSQFLVSDVLRTHNTLERVYKDMGIVSVVIPPLELFYVAVHVLNTHLVKRPYDRPLKQAPYAFNAVGMNIADYPFLFGVIDGLVSGIVVSDSNVGAKFVCVDSFDFILNGSPDEVMDGLFPDVRDTLNTHSPAPLDSTGNPCLVALVAVTYVFFLSAYQCLIHFNHTDKRRTFKQFVSHCLTNPVAEIPSGLVGNAERSLHLVSGNALLGFAHKIDGDKPFAEREMGIMHNGSAHNGKLVSATSALPAVVLFKLQCLYATATGTTNTVRPANVLKSFAALVVSLKIIYQGNEVNHGSKAS